MSKKKCKLCNRPYSYSYKLFGRGCFNTECSLLNISIPKKEKDKEKFFCNEIAKRFNEYGISQSQKYDLAEKYLTLEYLNKIKLGDLSKAKKQLEKEINNISFSKSVEEKVDKVLDNKIRNSIDVGSSTITLNKIYRLYKTTLKFNQKVSLFKKELENAKNNDEKEIVLEKYLLEDLKFVFDITKIGIPVYYQVYYAMQLTVWQLVIVGGLIKKYYLSAELLNKSLTSSNTTEEDYYVLNKDRIIEIKKDLLLQNKIKELLNKYSDNKEYIDLNENNVNSKELLVEFERGDLFYSLHNATINILGEKQDDKWNLNITLKDKYDFTDPKLKNNEYKESLLGSILNNCGVVSQQYGVIRPYNVFIEFKYDDFEKEVK